MKKFQNNFKECLGKMELSRSVILSPVKSQYTALGVCVGFFLSYLQKWFRILKEIGGGKNEFFLGHSKILGTEEFP